VNKIDCFAINQGGLDGVDFFAGHDTVTSEVVASAHSKGLMVIVWVSRRFPGYAKAHFQGCESILTSDRLGATAKNPGVYSGTEALISLRATYQNQFLIGLKAFEAEFIYNET